MNPSPGMDAVVGLHGYLLTTEGLFENQMGSHSGTVFRNLPNLVFITDITDPPVPSPSVIQTFSYKTAPTAAWPERGSSQHLFTKST